MAMQIPAFTTDQQYPFWILRKMMASFGTAGVVNPSTDFIVSPSSGLQVQVTSGSAFVQQTVNIEGSSAYNGLYLVMNDATANPFNTISAPVSNPRIDQVILRVYDVQEQGLGGSSKGQIEWLQGSESASASLATMGPGLANPGAAALPDNSIQLAYVLQTVGEVSIPAANILDVRPRTHGNTNIATAETRTNAAYGLMATPDQVTGIVVPPNGLIRVRYHALWQESVGGAARAAIFIGSNQLAVSYAPNGGASQMFAATQAAVCGSGITGQNMVLSSCPIGLLGLYAGYTGSPVYTGDVTTGQAVGIVATSGIIQGELAGATEVFAPQALNAGSAQVNTGFGGACEIFGLPAGTYTVSVRFKASSGSVTASNRKLWVEAVPFG